MIQINPSDNNIVNDFTAKVPQKKRLHKVSKAGVLVNELGSELNSLIQKALEVPPSDNSEAIHKAKQAISNGTLDTPEAIQITAEKLLAFGI